VYTLVLEDGRRVDATLRGRLKKDRRSGDKVVIGDRVTVESAGGSWVVSDVHERNTAFIRRGPGGRRPKVVAANLDRVFVVMAVRDPDPAPELVDRFLVAAEASGMHPTLVVNKVDLDGGFEKAEALGGLYGSAGYHVLAVSAESGAGLDALAREVCSGSSAFVGPSGVGKSTLLNALDPGLDLRIGELSRKTGRGRHTTVNARLLELDCGGTVADTPGFGDVGLWGVEPEELAHCFPEMRPFLDGCRFRGCAHVKEPDCAVREAVDRGDIPRSRYESYRVLREEADRPAW
jgi:ribosome biogenesis GTPase